MPYEFKLPELGESVEAGEIIKVHVAQGDHVKADQIVFEIETGKATIEVPAPVSGKVIEVHVAQGEQAVVGNLVLTLEPSEQAPVAQAAAAAPEEPAEETEVEPTPEAEPEPQPEPQPPAPPRAAAPAATPAPASAGPDRPPVPAAPSVRKFARELGVDIHRVHPEGKRITRADVKRHVKEGQAATAWVGASQVQPKLPDFAQWGLIDSENFNSIRKTTATHMALAWSTIPHVTQHDKADVTSIGSLRKTFGKRVEAQGGKLTVTAILLKVVARALKTHPKLNASIDMANRQVILKRYVNVGVAVDTPRGLLVPVIRNADQKNISNLAVELTELADRARSGKLGVDDMTGGTFTITNLGGIGGGHFTPIVNFPEVAILGVGRSAKEPVWINDEWQPRDMMPLSLSYDHRLVDGADAARFLRWIVDAIEQPFLLELEG